MSLIKKFSVGYSIEQSKKRKREHNDTTVKAALYSEDKTRKEVLSEEIVEPLLSFGYSVAQIVKAFKIYKFTTVDEAIYFLMRDPETKKFNHRFIKTELRNDFNSHGFKIINEVGLCFLCNEKIEDHIYSDVDEGEFKIELGHNNFRNRFVENEMKNTTFRGDKTNAPILKTLDGVDVIKSPKHRINELKHIEISKNTLDLFENPDVCRICFDAVLDNNNSVKFNCGHAFCKNCVVHHLTVNIKSGKVRIYNHKSKFHFIGIDNKMPLRRMP